VAKEMMESDIVRPGISEGGARRAAAVAEREPTSEELAAAERQRLEEFASRLLAPSASEGELVRSLHGTDP
jgi:hypothetical protein